MRRIILSGAVILIGIIVILYGLFNAQLINGLEISNKYSCGAGIANTQPYREGYINYCAFPEKAPEAMKQYANYHVFTGVVIVVLGGLLIVLKNPKPGATIASLKG